MKIIKRSGSEVTFDISKIMAAVAKANKEVVHSERLSDEQIETISDNVREHLPGDEQHHLRLKKFRILLRTRL